MGFLKALIFLVLVCACAFGIAFAVQSEASLDRGKALFNNPTLGTNGKTCSTCHPDGKGLEHAVANKDLADMINGCITQPLGGRALDVNSTDMRSLLLYIKSFGGKKPDAVRKAPVGC